MRPLLPIIPCLALLSLTSCTVPQRAPVAPSIPSIQSIIAPPQPRLWTNRLLCHWTTTANDRINHQSVMWDVQTQRLLTQYCAIEWRAGAGPWQQLATSNRSPIAVTCISTNSYGMLRARYFIQ